MLLAVTMRRPLEERFGADAYEEIRNAVREFGLASGAQTLALDDSDEMRALGCGPSLGPDAGSILSRLRQFTRPGGGADSVLLIGGHEVIPNWQITNPLVDRSIDPDEQVLSDNPYGAVSDTWEEYLAPSIPIGRLTNSLRGKAQDFVGLIEMATANRHSRPHRSRSAAVVNAGWSDFSQSAASALSDSIDWHFAPGYLMKSGSTDSDRECLYFNLHGFSGQAAWKGYDSVRSAFVTAVTPDAFDRENISGTVVFAENCYGAETINRTPNNSCALRLVREGAAFVGATGLAFGSHITPDFLLDDADLLAKYFWSAYRGGQTIGSALRDARSQYLAGRGALDLSPFQKKTLLQFVLLGDPGWTLH